MGVTDFSTTPASNTAISGINIAEGCAPSGINNAIRQLMADIASALTDGSLVSIPYLTKSAGYTVVAADKNSLIDCTAALTLTLTAAATLGAGFPIFVKANGGAVTIDPNASETINGSATLAVADGRTALVVCDGSNWHTALVSGGVDVTLAGSLDYLTISGQEITLGAIDLTTDVTGTLPVAEGGTGGASQGAAQTGLGLVIGTDIQAHSSVLDNATASYTTTEESKLAGIESGADVTDATNVAAAGALMGSINNSNWSGTDLSVANGGTGRSSQTAYAILCGGTTGTAAQQSVASVGSSGQVLTSNGAGALPTFQAASSGPSQAVQSAIEAETNQDTYIPPDLIKHSPGVAKGWINFNGSGTIATRDSYNVASITDNGVGDYTVTWDVDFSSTDYSCSTGGARFATGVEQALQGPGANDFAVGSVRIYTGSNTSTSLDWEIVCIAAYGDQ